MQQGIRPRDSAVKRILFVNAWSSCHGGSSTSLIDIVTHLDRNRYAPTVQCPEPGPLPDRLREAGIPVSIQRNSSLSKSKILPFSLDLLAQRTFLRKGAIDLVHFNVGGSRSSIATAARVCRIPYIQHVRNPVKPYNLSSVGYRHAARIITNSDAIGAPLREDVTLNPKTKTIYNGVDLSLYDESDDRRTELPANSHPVVGFVGQLVPRKGVRTLIEALSKLTPRFPNLLLVLVGRSPSGEDDYETECRKRVGELGLNTHVLFAGFRRDVAAWMRTFDVFALPTRSEPFGKVIIEAMAAECPVVATNVGGIPEIIGNPDLGILVPPDDPEATASAIGRFLEDGQLARRVGSAGSVHARNRFGLEAMVRRIEATYDQVFEETLSE